MPSSLSGTTGTGSFSMRQLSTKATSLSEVTRAGTLKPSSTVAKWSGSAEPVNPPDYGAWWPSLPPPPEDEPCTSYRFMAKNCGCIFRDRRETLAHSKDCVLSKKGALTEAQHSGYILGKKPLCPGTVIVHQFLKTCPEHKGLAPKVLLDRSMSRARKIGGLFKDKGPEPSEDLKQFEAERLPKLIQQWQDRIEMEAIAAENKAEARRKVIRDAYTAYIAHLRAEEVQRNVPENLRFRLFDFFGGPGGDLLTPCNSNGTCAYCSEPDTTNNLESLPCGCVVHRQCAAKKLIGSEWYPLTLPTCVCKGPTGEKTTFNLKRLVTHFEDPKIEDPKSRFPTF